MSPRLCYDSVRRTLYDLLGTSIVFAIECTCPVLIFAIKPETFVDDGDAAYAALKEKADTEKAAKTAARKAGLLKEEEDED
jgi:hypothetical protein